MPYERLRPSFVFDEERMKRLRDIAPEAFADGRINWETLRESLGEYLEDEGPETEHFGLFWPGKKDARKVASVPSRGTLIPMKGEGINEETTKNIFIEGENLEVLKLLQKSYAGRIKMIYIDPPYNTGNDFIYDDNFTEPLEEYLKYTGQMDEEGRVLTTNKKADGRFHSKWLSMMYPRLRLARNLLREDGAIFVSIDDNEIDNLRALCDELFGEECFVAQLTVLCNPKGRSQDKYFATNHEYVVVYSKSVLPKGSFAIAKDEAQIEIEYTEQDEAGRYRLLELRNTHRDFGRHNRRNLFFPLYVNDEGEVFLEKQEHLHQVLPLWDDEFEGCWTWERAKVKSDGNFLTARQINGRWKIYRKSYASGADRMLKTILIDSSFYTERGQKEFNKLFDTKVKLFQSPKSPHLIARLAQTITTESDIALDFFAGSATAAHALFLINAEDMHNRRFIIVQMPELCDEKSDAYKAGYKTIAEIAKERIRRVIKGYGSDPKPVDAGFYILKLDRSHFTTWKDYEGANLKELDELFKKQETPLVDGWKAENLLVEVMLQEGFPLDSEVAELEGCKANRLIQVTSESCRHRLLVSFDEKIARETIDGLAIEGEDIFICLDSALTDEQKATLSDKGFLKTI